jgi:hypothetical protein
MRFYDESDVPDAVQTVTITFRSPTSASSTAAEPPAPVGRIVRSAGRVPRGRAPMVLVSTTIILT